MLIRIIVLHRVAVHDVLIVQHVLLLVTLLGERVLILREVVRSAFLVLQDLGRLHAQLWMGVLENRRAGAGLQRYRRNGLTLGGVTLRNRVARDAVRVQHPLVNTRAVMVVTWLIDLGVQGFVFVIPLVPLEVHVAAGFFVVIATISGGRKTKSEKKYRSIQRSVPLISS